MGHKRHCVTSLLATFASVDCSMPPIVIEEKDVGKPVEVEAGAHLIVHLHAGKHFTLRIEEIGGTNYRWRVEAKPKETEVSSKERFIAPAGNALGAAGAREIDFTPLKPGSFSYVFRLRENLPAQADPADPSVKVELKVE